MSKIRSDSYWLGYQHGRRLALYEPHVAHEPALKLNVKLATQATRAFALGELRGYRQVLNLPEPRR